MKNNKKRNIVAYVFAGLTIPLGLLTIFFLIEAQMVLNAESTEQASSFGQALGEGLGKAFAFVILLIFTFMSGIGSYIFGIISVSILGTCIKQTEDRRRIANIVILAIVGTILVAIAVGIILVLFVVNKS